MPLTSSFRIPRRSLIASSMMLVMLWLTVSLPFSMNGYADCGAWHADETAHLPIPAQEADANPMSDMPEEKANTGLNNLNEEYLHDSHPAMECGSAMSKRLMFDQGDAYSLSFHGELLVPPPNAC